jgi:hypothetical protein
VIPRRRCPAVAGRVASEGEAVDVLSLLEILADVPLDLGGGGAAGGAEERTEKFGDHGILLWV